MVFPECQLNISHKSPYGENPVCNRGPGVTGHDKNAGLYELAGCLFKHQIYIIMSWKNGSACPVGFALPAPMFVIIVVYYSHWVPADFTTSCVFHVVFSFCCSSRPHPDQFFTSPPVSSVAGARSRQDPGSPVRGFDFQFYLRCATSLVSFLLTLNLQGDSAYGTYKRPKD